ncbi:LexA family transcriptional regulator [Pararobbsia alpina]|uniref:HTH-type transcriptional regulator PrtR n=1 Tax=Pararobbsia alpina TaxID=621374 RepID=A0A6S7B3R8_9BURK|nr:XRE family transcriptional regulator [Pararobbsia alpina]CAB3784537.1 HTH-type transcriptional regulator PrtR [Pararobbsia alpina]
MPASPLTEARIADAKRLREAFAKWQKDRRKLGEPSSQEAAGETIGFSQSTMSQYLLAKIPLNPEAVAKFAALLGCSGRDISPELAGQIRSLDKKLSAPEDRKHGSAPDDPPSTGQNADVIKRLLPNDKGNVVAWENEGDLPHDPERVWIDRYDYHFSAGSGVIQWEVREKKALPFDAGFFKAIGSKPKDCKLVVVRGDSMEPFLFNRDMMMIDSSRTAIKEGHIYAIHFEDEALVKLIFKQAGGGLLLRSYNSAKYPDKIIGPDQSEFVTIAGELIYRSGSGPAGGN